MERVKRGLENLNANGLEGLESLNGLNLNGYELLIS